MKTSFSGPVRSAVVLTLAALVAGVSGTAMAQTRASQERVIVEFKPGKLQAARAAIQAAGGRVVLDLSEDNAVAAVLPAGKRLALRRNAAVASIDDDPIRTVMGSRQATVRRAGASAAVMSTEVVPFGIPMVQADQVAYGSARKVCVIDSGYDLSHEDLQKTGVTGQNFTTEGAWSTDENQHGTHVTGTIAALGGNGVGVVGVVPGGNLNIYVAKVFDSTGSAASSTIMKGVRACKRAGANVVNMSLGGGRPTNFEAKTYQRYYDGGMLIIAAAGNAGTSALSYPASYPSVMSVAAIDVNKAKADFSQFNAEVEIAGPGVATLSTVPTGSNREATLSVGGGSFAAAPMDGSPLGSASAALYNFGTGEVDDAGVAGKVCLIARGNISFSDKVLRCQANGGVAAVIYNNTAGQLFGTMNGVVTTIPSMGVSDVDGAALLGQVGAVASAAVAVSAYNYAEFNGTSMATPHVAGVAALVWSNFPACGPARIREALNATAQDLGAAGRDVEFGFGLVQAKAAADWLTTNGCAAP